MGVIKLPRSERERSGTVMGAGGKPPSREPTGRMAMVASSGSSSAAYWSPARRGSIRAMDRSSSGRIGRASNTARFSVATRSWSAIRWHARPSSEQRGHFAEPPEVLVPHWTNKSTDTGLQRTSSTRRRAAAATAAALGNLGLHRRAGPSARGFVRFWIIAPARQLRPRLRPRRLHHQRLPHRPCRRLGRRCGGPDRRRSGRPEWVRWQPASWPTRRFAGRH